VPGRLLLHPDEAIHLREIAKDKDAFLARVLREPRIFVQGADDDIGKFTADRKAETP
jgi:uncharacterized NAD-dependent epimerase/dehydratase family protein